MLEFLRFIPKKSALPSRNLYHFPQITQESDQPRPLPEGGPSQGVEPQISHKKFPFPKFLGLMWWLLPDEHLSGVVLTSGGSAGFMLILPRNHFSLLPLPLSCSLSSHYLSFHSHYTSPLPPPPPPTLLCLSLLSLSRQAFIPALSSFLSHLLLLLLSSIFPICQISSITHCFSSASLFFHR